MTTTTPNPIHALAFTALAFATFTPAHAQVSAQEQPNLSASERVKSDLADWRSAGFDGHTSDRLSYDVYGAEYKQRYAKYLELKQLREGTATSQK